MVKVEKNKDTNMWRYLDTKTNTYSSQEWSKRKVAWKMACNYFDVMYKNKS
jgi:hypothetical protein